MNRRGFLLGLMTAGVAVAACAKPPGAEAAPLTPKSIDEAAKALETAPVEADGLVTEGHYTGWPHRHVRRYRYYRPRFYRRRYYRPHFYYRPRRHFYYRPHFYRRRWGW